MRAELAPCGVLMLLLVAGCAGAAAPAATPPRPSPVSPTPGHTSAPPVHPRPAGPCVKALGATVHLRDHLNGQQLDLTLSSLSLSSRALATDHGAAPANGLYVTVQAKVVNRGAGVAAIDPLDFRADTAGRTGVTVQDGNAPYSGASSELRATPIDPGETITGPLTFDLAVGHGKVRYAPGGTTDCTWTF